MPLDYAALASKWQARWKEAKLFEAEPDSSREKFFVTVPYPYVNGAPHVGHSYSYFRTDAYARFKRMCGFNVLFPQGFHATGEPILGAVERLRNGDQKQIDGFRASGATDADLERFKEGPQQVAKFWMARWIFDLDSAGMSIDWRRSFITTDLTPTYSRFIEWQYNTLRRKGYVVQGTHPVIYCPHDESPTGDHDRLEGEGESPVEYVLVKFTVEIGGERLVLPCATLRPETTFGVTNLWLNPAASYVKANVGNEIWVIAKEALIKLADQRKTVKAIGEIPAKSLIGKSAANPASGAGVIILPAPFVSPENATGVVMSVPAHAPFDYIALEDAKKDSGMQSEYGIPAEAIVAVKPVSLISVPGYGEFPAAEECRKLGVKSQADAVKLEKATSEVYKKEFHQGTLNARCKGFAGVKVADCKDAIIAEFAGKGIADSMWECTGKVVCRCMSRCHVKILENQWFLKFSDRAWKDAVQTHIAGMSVFPEEARLQLSNTVEWLANKACTRKSGLGTKLPWDKAWIVETLSDSTIYMAYYTISRIINERGITAKNLPDEAFDYIFLGVGDASAIRAKSGMGEQTLRDMRAEFEYFYPVDLRNSGKDLLQNHLLFYLFHHVALFRPQHWPRGISVNGYVTVEGEKMSKSKGNFIPFSALVTEFGADLVRANIIASGENMDDADWKSQGVATYRRLFDFVYDAASAAKPASTPGPASGGKSNPPGRSGRLLESRLNSCAKSSAAAYEQLRFRTACQYAIFDSCAALKSYLSGNPAPDYTLVRTATHKIALMSAPVAPHFAEEICELLGFSGFASLAHFPVPDDSKIDVSLEQEEKAVESVAADVQKILQVAGISKPARITVFTAPAWKSDLLQFAVAASKACGKFDFGAVLKSAMLDARFAPHAKELPALIKSMEKAINFFKESPMPQGSEFELLFASQPVLSAAFGCPVEVIRAESATQASDPQGKASRALPFKPAILVQ